MTNNAVPFVGYYLAFLVALIAAARWISRHHPALRDCDAERLPSTEPPTRPLSPD